MKSTPSRAGRLSLVVAVLFLAGCKDSPTDPVPVDQTPSLGFTYSGAAHSGVYQVEGDVPLGAGGTVQHGTWAAGGEAPGVLAVLASRARTAPFADVVVIALSGVTAPGTYPIDVRCEQPGRVNCAAGRFMLNYDYSRAQFPEASYRFTQGTVTVSELNDERVRGTFAVQGVASPGSAAITITSGSFDVPVVSGLAVSPSRGLSGRTLDQVISQHFGLPAQ